MKYKFVNALSYLLIVFSSRTAFDLFLILFLYVVNVDIIIAVLILYMCAKYKFFDRLEFVRKMQIVKLTILQF